MNESMKLSGSEGTVVELIERSKLLVDDLHRQVVDVLEELDLTETTAAALWLLGPEDTAQSRRELATKLQCDPSNVTLVADRLEARGLVERATDTHDRRVKALRLTTGGREVRQRLIDAMVRGSSFARLTAAEQGQLNDLLAKCLDPALPKSPQRDPVLT